MVLIFDNYIRWPTGGFNLKKDARQIGSFSLEIGVKNNNIWKPPSSDKYNMCLCVFHFCHSLKTNMYTYIYIIYPIISLQIDGLDVHNITIYNPNFSQTLATHHYTEAQGTEGFWHSNTASLEMEKMFSEMELCRIFVWDLPKKVKLKLIGWKIPKKMHPSTFFLLTDNNHVIYTWSAFLPNAGAPLVPKDRQVWSKP